MEMAMACPVPSGVEMEKWKIESGVCSVQWRSKLDIFISRVYDLVENSVIL